MAMDDLTDDTLTEILLRVPVKTAHQCKVVSKRWHSLISNPYFERCYRHRHRHGDNRLSLLVNYCNPRYGGYYTKNLEVESVSENNHYSASSVDFLNQHTVCFVSNDLVLSSIPYLYISNPLTKQSYRLPEPPSGSAPHEICPFFLIGCISSVDDPTLYKVVIIKGGRIDRSGKIFHIKMYTSDTNDWSTFVVPAPPNLYWNTFVVPAQYTTTLDGAFYCCGNMIIVYDPFNNPQQFDFFHLPQDVNLDVIRNSRVPILDQHSLCIANVEQHLRLYYWRFIRTSTSTLSVWDMEDPKSARTWITKYIVDLTSINWLSVNVSDHERLTLTGFNPNDGNVLYAFSSDERLLAVNLGNKTVRLVHNFNTATSPVLNLRMFPYGPPPWPTPIAKSAVAATG